MNETYVRVSGIWRYVYWAVDDQGQVIDVFLSKKRDTKAAWRFFAGAIGVHGAPTEVTTCRAPALARAITELLPLALHDTTQSANQADRTASVVMQGHAFVQNLRRGHYELGVDACLA